MDDAVICGQLRQIFPQIELNVIQRTVEEAKTNEGVDILTHCIEVVLARQEEARWLGNINNGQQGNDDVVVVKSIRKETSRKGKTRDIPLVLVREDGPGQLIRRQAETPQPFSDIDSDNYPGFESSDDEADDPIRYMNKINYNGDSSPIVDQFSDDNFDRLITNLSSPPLAIVPQQMTAPASPLRHTVIKHLTFDKQQHQQPSTTPNWQPLAMPGQQPSETPIRQLPATPVMQLSATPVMQPSATPIQQPLAMPIEKPLVTPNQQSMPMGCSLLDFIKQMFPEVNRQFVQNLSQQGYDLNSIVNILIDRPDMQKSGPSSNPPSPKEPAQTKEIDYFTDFSQKVSPSYYRPCEYLLRNEFQRVSAVDIRKAMRICNDHYAPARKLLEEALVEMNQNQRGKSPHASTLPKGSAVPQNSTSLQSSTLPTTSSLTRKNKFTITRLLASKRTPVKLFDKIHPELQLEIDFVKKRKMLNEEKKNAIYAAHVNKQQYIDEGELIECGCCFGEFPFEEIIQCSDGHLFCKECLHGYAKEIIFGSAMTSVKLICMGESCDQPFPYSQLEKCLTKNEIEKYQGRLQEDCLAKVDIPNLHQCPFCEFVAIIPETEKVFTCMNPKCMKETCIECNEEWKDHFGKKCNEIEKKSQTNLRLSYEERMTVAKVRKCAKCSLTFTKQDGCNKMTCRCGTTQCYVCRKSSINYNHFCRHPRDPGKKCQKCTACSLWTDPTEDDDLAVKQLQEESVVAKRKLMEEIEQSPSKKQKV